MQRRWERDLLPLSPEMHLPQQLVEKLYLNEIYPCYWSHWHHDAPHLKHAACYQNPETTDVCVCLCCVCSEKTGDRDGERRLVASYMSSRLKIMIFLSHRHVMLLFGNLFLVELKQTVTLISSLLSLPFCECVCVCRCDVCNVILWGNSDRQSYVHEKCLYPPLIG